MASDTVRELQFRVGFAADSSITKVGGDVRKEIESIKAAAREGEKKGLLEALGERVGKGSEFAHLLHAAEGGGALFAVSQVGKIAEEFTGKMVEMHDSFLEGKISAREMADEMARSLPIVGAFAAAEQNIEEYATGRLRKEREITEQLGRQGEYVKEQAALRREDRARRLELAQSARAASQAEGRVGIEGDAKGRAELRDRLANSATDAPQRLREENDAIRQKYQPSIDQLEQYAAVARTRKQNAQSIGEGSVALIEEQQVAEQTAAALKKEMEDSINAHTKGFWKTQNAEQSEGAAELAKGQADHARERNRLAIKEQDETSEIAFAADKARLLAAGRGQEAELEQLKGSLELQKNEIDRAAAEEARISRANAKFGLSYAERPEQIEARAMQKKAALDEKFEADAADAKRRGGETDLARRQSVEDAVNRVRLDGLNAQAQAGDQAAAAEERRLELAQKYADERREIVRMMREENGLSAAQIATLKEALKSLGAAQAAEVRGAQRQAGRGLEDVAEKTLQALGRNNPAADSLIAKFQTAKEFRDQKEKLQGIAGDRSLTQAQRDQAKAMLAALPGQAQAAIANSGVIHQPIALTAENQQNMAGIFGRAGLTGSGAEAQERAFLEQRKGMDSATGAMNAVAEQLKALIADLQGSGEQDPFDRG